MALTLNHLTICYGEKVIIKDLSYHFPPRGCVLLVGTSGCGKTTLLRAIAHLLPVKEGEILDADKVSFAFQEHRLFPALNAAENIAVATAGHKKNTVKAVEMLLSLGFASDEVFLHPSELSGGMKQRVSLARAFLKDTPILLLDEPFKELDPALVMKVTELIRKEAENRLVILTAHTKTLPNLPEAKTLSLDDGSSV